MQDHHIIIFDGVCNICNSSINFIKKRDKKSIFKYLVMQDKKTLELIQKYNIKNFDLDTLILIKNEKYYLRSDAVLEITKDLSGFLKILQIFKILPKAFRDYIYKIFAKNRYRLFGKSDKCNL